MDGPAASDRRHRPRLERCARCRRQGVDYEDLESMNEPRRLCSVLLLLVMTGLPVATVICGVLCDTTPSMPSTTVAHHHHHHDSPSRPAASAVDSTRMAGVPPRHDCSDPERALSTSLV